MVDSVAVIVKRVLAQLVDRVVKQDLVAHIDAVLVRGRRLEEEGRRLEEEGRRLEEEGRRLEELARAHPPPAPSSKRRRSKDARLAARAPPGSPASSLLTELS